MSYRNRQKHIPSKQEIKVAERKALRTVIGPLYFPSTINKLNNNNLSHMPFLCLFVKWPYFNHLKIDKRNTTWHWACLFVLKQNLLINNIYRTSLVKNQGQTSSRCKSCHTTLPFFRNLLKREIYKGQHFAMSFLELHHRLNRSLI